MHGFCEPKAVLDNNGLVEIVLPPDELKLLFVQRLARPDKCSCRIARATGPICHPPVCGKTCSPQARTVEDEQPCYRIERREICIPAVTFPWQKCCGPPKCGRVICVNKLEQDTRYWRIKEFFVIAGKY